MPDEEPWTWDASTIAGRVRSGSLSAVEVARSHLARIETVNGHLNALVDLRPDEVLDQAARVDATIAAGDHPGPLAGVPVAVKINTDQQGYLTTHGVPRLANAPSPVDAPVIANLRRAGAVFVGRSNSPAFGYRSFTTNALHGTTLSPWDRDTTPGGSSGGSSVAVATGMACLGQGNDLAGSLRYPAYASGVVGLRPTVGHVPRSAAMPTGDSLMSQLMTVDGPLARTVADTRLMYGAMSFRGDPRDLFWAGPWPHDDHHDNTELRRVALVRTIAGAPLHHTVDQALTTAAVRLTEAGYQVEELVVPELDEAFRLWWLLTLCEYPDADVLLDQVGDQEAATVVRNYAAIAASWTPGPYDLPAFISAYARRQTLIQRIQQLLEAWPMLLTPVSTQPPFEQGFDARTLTTTEEFMMANWPMMALPALALPAIAVPTGLAGGIPTGVQLVGRRHSDAALMTAARSIESASGDAMTPTDVTWL